ncbi:metal ABC transporter permease [bacterium]|nr:metal ABC transporter permease [candidate division CSSED10-310 bacterium]
MMNAFFEPWTHAYFVKAMVGGSIIAIACAVLGCYIVLRKMAFIGDAMSHALLPGVGIGYLVMNALIPGGFTAGGLLLGALIAAVITSVSISALSRIQRINEDAAIGIVYTGLFASGVVILTRYQQHINIDLNHFFQGDVYGISWEDMWLSAVIGSLVVGTIILFYRYFTIVSFDPIMARSIGLHAGFIHTSLTIMIALICVAGISMVGVIMIVGLLITPAALAYLFTDRLPRMMILAAAMGVLSVITGLYFSEWINASGGGAIMFAGFALFLIGLIVAPNHGLIAGWLRRRRLVPITDIEDLLKAFYEKRDLESVAIPVSRRHRAIRKMTMEGLLEPRVGKERERILSRRGYDEAAHILRSHQLWEHHFIEQGMDPHRAHEAAETLEHLHDRMVLDRFDDELGHPQTDTHGIPIPGEREADSDEYPDLTLSLLRPGDRGRVTGYLRDNARCLPLREPFLLETRDETGDFWQIMTSAGPIRLNHEQADALVVERLPDTDPVSGISV